MQPEPIALWPGPAPGTDGLEDRETCDDGVVKKTHQPTLTPFPAPPDRATGEAIILCPGGGYNVIMFEREGVQVARRLNEAGITAFVLKYRIKFHDAEPFDHETYALMDAQRAVRYVRTHAARWSVRPDRIGIGGFSAGGHLAANAGTRFDHGDPDADDAVGRESSRPDFLMLIYPNTADFDERVDGQTPPTFLVHAHDDWLTPMNSVNFYTALKEQNVRAALHIFTHGGHGFDLGRPGTPNAAWPDLFVAWLSHPGAEPEPAA